MANYLGTLRARATLETADFQKGLQGARSNLQSFSKQFDKLQVSTLTQIATFATLSATVRAAIATANEYAKAQQQLAATAKLTGVALGTLQSTSRQAQSDFHMNAISADAFTIELTKLASKAGNIGQASSGLAAFLDIGAARGLTAAETLQAVQQSILGIDEGTDKLFSKNPSVLYQEYAASIGTTAGKLSDQQKAQALLNAAMQDGAKVRGEYQNWLNTAAGKQQLLAQEFDKTKATLGQALTPALLAIMPVLTWISEWIGHSIQGWQLVGAAAVYAFRAAHAGVTYFTDGLAAARQEMAAALDEFKKKKDEIGGQSAPIKIPAQLQSTTTATGNAKPDKDTLNLAGERQDILLQNALETARNLNAVELTRLGTQATLTDGLRLRLGLVAHEYQLQRDAVLSDSRLSDGARQNELLRLDLQRQREDSQLRLNAAAEDEVSIVEKNRREAEKAADEQQKRRQSLADGAANLFTGAISGKLDGSQIGSQIGSMIGNFVPFGGVLGSIGGAIGGLFGHKKKQEQQSPVVKTLSAIERATKETVTAIQAQTDSLLNPENRFLNLPSTFTAPRYQPSYGGGGPITYGDTNVSINVNVAATKTSAEDIASVVQKEVGAALFAGRRNQSWGR